MICLSPVKLEGFEFPCGKCRGCRVNKTREWALRMMHELEEHELSAFVTLSYSEEFLPKGGTLVKKDIQDWMKRFRKALGKRGRNTRYYCCGEYGERTGRPHYHLIMYGVSRKDKDLILSTWGKCTRYGLDVSPVSYETCRYVSQYIQKKLGGDLAKERYGDRLPPFQLLSKGIGKAWMERNSERIKNSLVIKQAGKEFAVPRYYKKKLGIRAEMYDDLAKQRMAEDTEWFEKREIPREKRSEYYRDLRVQKNEEMKAIDDRKSRLM